MRSTALVLALAATLAGCARLTPPPVVVEDASVAALPTAFLSDFRPPLGDATLWWRGFDDARLDQEVDRALAANLSLVAARQRLAAARDLLRAERSDLRPSIDALGGVTAGAVRGGGFDLGVDGSAVGLLDLDLNGRLSAEIEAAAANARASDYLLADARRLVVSGVVEQYVELRRAEARLDLLAQSTDLQRQTLRVVELRFGAGLSANLDVRRAAADLARTEAQRGLLDLQRAQAARSLSVLTADPPQPLPPLPDDPAVPSYAGGPPVGLPADLLRRRPDVLVAEARLAQAAALVGVEQADLYPTLVIPADVGLGQVIGGGLLNTVFASVGAVLGLPLLDGGRRRAEVDASYAEAAARLAEYRLLLLDALAQVETALVAVRSFEDRIVKLEVAIEQSTAAFRQLDALYREGLTSLFDVLDAQRQLIQSREALIDAEAARAQAIVDLFRAVGGNSVPQA